MFAVLYLAAIAFGFAVVVTVALSPVIVAVVLVHDWYSRRRQQ